jgi:hypothetical protein
MGNGRAALSLTAVAVALSGGCSPRSASRVEVEDAAVPAPAAGLDAGMDEAAGPDAAAIEVATTAGDGAWSGRPLVIAVGNDGRHALSLDGTRWTNDVREAMGNRDGGPLSLRAVAYAGGRVVAVGGGCNPDCVGRVVLFDGIRWREAAPPGRGRLDGVAQGAGIWVAVGTGGVVLRSSDGGESWAASSPAMGGGLRAVSFGEVGGTPQFIAVGDGYVRLHSLDGGLTWTDLQPSSGTSDGYRAVAIGGGVAVAAGGRGNAGRRIRSLDGAAWSDEVTAGPDLLSLVHDGERFMAFSGSGDNTVHLSADGKTWVTQPTRNAGANVAVGQLGGGRLFVSRIAPATIRTSRDGLTWMTGAAAMPGDATINAFVFTGE